MNQVKIGKFIAKCRKENNLTQSQLAEKLNITDRAVSKWENGKSMPDYSIILDLCKILNININDLLNGEVVMENYKEKSEDLILELTKQKQEADKRLLRLENFIGIFGVIYLLSFVLIGAFIEMESWLKILLIVLGFIIGGSAFVVALKIEQIAGYYKCKKCHYKYIPTFKQINLAMHVGKTRYMKCPKCQKWSWNKKTLNKD